MNRLKVLLVVALLASIAGLGQAASIIVISDAYAPDDPTPDVTHEDDALVAFLEELGYEVDTSGMGGAYKEGNNPFADAAKVSALLSADLVLVSRRTSSGSYDNDRMNWNQLNNPLLLMSGYLTRGGSNNKWGWTTGASSDVKDGDVLSGLTTVDVIGAHPFLPDPEVFDWSANGGVPPKGVFLPNSSSEVVGGTVVAEYGADRPFLIDYAAGIDLDAGNGTTDFYGVLGDRRAFMGHWGYDVEGYDFSSMITDDYKQILGETIAVMVPEPATLMLLGLGGLLLRKRR